MIKFSRAIFSLARLKSLPAEARFFCLAILLLLIAGCAWKESSYSNIPFVTPAPQKDRVRVITRREGDVTRFFVENNEWAEITMTFNFGLINLKSSTELPATMTFAPHQTAEALNLSPINANAGWKFSLTNYHHIGSCLAVHDDSVLYSLPYAPGKAFRVTQGYHGAFSHTGANEYAIDWELPCGTAVYAARGGTIIKTKDNSEVNGEGLKFAQFNNQVLILHSDGTIGDYCHLQKGGIKVHEGDVVREGDLIALSGNTGFSTGPHLHFSVFKAINGRERESIPVRFKIAGETGVTLKSGRKYTATQVLRQGAVQARATGT